MRGGAGTPLVGNPETVAIRIREYQEIGIETFVFSGYPHLEESYRFDELVFPLLQYNVKDEAGAARVGETIGNEVRPVKLGRV